MERMELNDQIEQAETQFEQGDDDRGKMPASHGSEAGKKPTLSYREMTL
jgi:hypothetical protein